MDPQDILDLIADPAAEWRYRRQLVREGYERGHATGWHEGYEQACRDLERHWQEIAAHVKQNASAPTFAELQQRRWVA